MRLLVTAGRRGDALAQYQLCQRLLAQDLGVEPDAATTRLYQDIVDGKLEEPAGAPLWSFDVSPASPTFLTETAPVHSEEPLFVGREQQLEGLRAHLQRATGGCEQVVLVIGGAGRGKTVLLQEFVRQVQSELPPVVATGHCNAYSGGGDPYLPFRQVLRALTGDVEDLWAAGRITTGQATQLWELLPVTAQAIVELGPDLIETFLAGPPLLARAAAAVGTATPWLPRLARLVRARTTSQSPADLEQHTLLEEYATVLERVAGHQPLIIILEDLHWVDRGSAELLLHLGRRLLHSRIMLVGAYRPDEIAVSRDGGQHPLVEAVEELRSLHGDIVIDLALDDPAASWRFVNDLLDTEPNRLGDAFRRELHHRTRGHPLFTVEMLRMLQEQGDLSQDPDGRWVEGSRLAWDAVPARVEAVIRKRVSRLNPLAHEYLTIASVEGEDLTAEVIARVLDRPERQVLRTLALDLGRKHRLLQERPDHKTGSQSLSRFRFSHHLIQQYVYNSLSSGERRRLHWRVAEALESLYADQIEAVTMPLAYHYGHTDVRDKTVHYLTQAGHQARKRYDGEQAAHYFSEALALVPGDCPQRFHLLAARASAYDFLAQRSAQKADLDAMEALALTLGDRGLQCDALLACGQYYLATEVFRAQEPARKARAIAQEVADDVREAYALRQLSWEGRLGADFQTCCTQLKEASTRFKTASMPGEAAGCLFMLARRLTRSGKHFFELDLAEEALALSRESGDLRLQAIAQKNLAISYTNANQDNRALPLAQEALAMQRDLGDRREQCSTMDLLGVIVARLGRQEEAAATFRRCLALADEIGSEWDIAGAVYGLKNYGYLPDGNHEEWLAFLDERLQLADASRLDWLAGFLVYLKAGMFIDLGQYDQAMAATRASAIPVPKETDPISHVVVLHDTGRIHAKLGHHHQARQALEEAVALAQSTSDPYQAGWPLADLASLALYTGTPDALCEGLAQAQTSIAAAQAVSEEQQWARALDVCARLHLALGQAEEAFDVSSQAMRLLDSHPWLPTPQAHLHTHHLALRALQREEEARDPLQRAHERIMLVAGNLADDSLRGSWLHNVRVNREILAHRSELGPHSRHTGPRAPAATA
jgi:tetratricopeptide (TPR) repeat protein